MIPRRSPSPWCLSLSTALLAFLAAGGAPAAAQVTPSPYVFFLFDTSGSMNFSPPCTQAQVDAGSCGFLCPTGDCFVPNQADDPASKLFQLKEGLYTSLAGRGDDLLLGFASLNQDALNVRAKHWIYQATSNGPLIPGGPSYPAIGAQEVFGLTWSCSTGSGNSQTGCSGTLPARLNVPWELTRVQRLPKGGLQFNQSVDVYIRLSSGVTIYKVRYVPAPPTGLGASGISTNVSLFKCNNNTACSSPTLLSTQSVSWQRVSELLSWDNGGTGWLNQVNPQLSYFSQVAAADTTANNTCSGWDPNTDTTPDRTNTSSFYTLRWPTDSSDPRGSLFYVGDVVPLDWTNSHKLDLERRLAPNLVLNPLATPDFRIATYLNDNRAAADTFLKLKNELARPLIASGSTPLGASLASFASWYTGCTTTCPPSGGWQGTAALSDPDWADRQVSLVVLTDGDETCGGDPCAQAANLYDIYGVRTFIVAFGAQPVAGSAIECTAAAGGTGAPYYPQTEGDLIAALSQIYAAAALP